MLKLKKAISGMQTGADFFGVVTAKKFGYEVGGTMPKGFKTTAGNHPEYAELYNIKEHESDSYVPRTYQNVKDSDGTIRLAFNFSSPGEIVTIKAINQYNKPHIDVDLNKPRPVEDIVKWLDDNNIEILNVAGNSEKTYMGTGIAVQEYLEKLFNKLKVI
jgi:hypothetical protein